MDAPSACAREVFTLTAKTRALILTRFSGDGVPSTDDRSVRGRSPAAFSPGKRLLAVPLNRPPVSLKVPVRIAAIFWAIKLLTTALGESTSDYLVHNVNPYLAVVGGFVVFAAAMVLQLRADRYVPWVYWLAVAMVAVFGTMAADVVHIEFGVPYLVSSVLFAALLVAVFWTWSHVEGTLSIHSITTVRRELLYWAAVLATFAMGTALGDLVAYRLNLGFLSAGIVFAALFALPGLAFYALRINAVFAFWAAYVLTRPLGASFADWTGKDRNARGLGWGDGPVAAVLAVLIVAGVTYLTVSRSDQEDAVELEPVLDKA